MKKKICIIIVTWNGKNHVLTCLRSIYAAKHETEMHLIVVDNGSIDGSVSAIQSQYPHVEVVEAGENLGFTGGNNIGIRKALERGVDFVWLLNNDTQVDKNALSLINAFDDIRVGIAGSKIYFASGYEYHKERYGENDRGRVFWYAGGMIDWKNMYASHRGVDEVDKGQYDETEETQFVTGCSMMIRREVFEKIGLLDDKFFAYLEDLDFCLRAKAAHYRLMYIPKSVVWHANAGSSAVGSQLHQYYMTRNRMLLGFRYAPVRTKVALLREAVRSLVTGPSVVKHAIRDWFLGRYGNQYSNGTLR